MRISHTAQAVFLIQFFGTFLSLNLSPTWLFASAQVATVTQVEGTVTLFSHPSKTLPQAQPKNADEPRVLFEGEYFIAQSVTAGTRVEKGNIIRTAPGAKARIVYENGDQINLGSGSAYRVTWNEDTTTKKAAPEINLSYGKLRGIIEKGGPRSRLRIRTKTAVMGVRGTDFFIAQGGGTDPSTEISIIRGTVEVTPVLPDTPPNVHAKTSGSPSSKTAPAEPMQILAGYSAEINPTASQTLASTPHIEIRKTTQEELQGIGKSSFIDPSKAQAPPSKEVQKTIEVLEKKAVLTSYNDIQKHGNGQGPYTETQIKDLPTNVDEINRAALQELIKTAPQAPVHRKPYKSELEDVDGGAYERYFKKVE